MDRKLGYDEYGYPLYDAEWFWVASRPALVLLAIIAALAFCS